MGRHIRHKKRYWRELKLVHETEEKMLALANGDPSVITRDMMNDFFQKASVQSLKPDPPMRLSQQEYNDILKDPTFNNK